MPNSTVPAAATGLPSNIIPFPVFAATATTSPIDFEPDAQKMQDAYAAICTTWQFAHLGAAAMDRAIEELIRMGGASQLVRENGRAIRYLYEAIDFMTEADERLHESLDRVAGKLEAQL